MDFFESQEVARRSTRRLVALFILAVIGIIIAVYVIIHLLLGIGRAEFFDPILFAIIAGGVLLLVGIGSGYRTLSLRRGGPAVAELLGGRRIALDTLDPDERRLVNVVQEMAIASNVPVPTIYIMDDEEGINAFAAGHTPADAAVAVTRGTLRSLTRDELQGVIAHEFSHILNGDMRLNIRLMGLLFGILLIAVIGQILLRSGAFSRRGGRGGGRGGGGGGAGQIALIGLALIVVGYIGVFFGRLIQAAVSRQREFLADAAAVQFTRNPAGIGGALLKIRDSTTEGGAGSSVENPHAVEAGHFFFASNLRRMAARGFATHPPLVERIRRVDPELLEEPGARRVKP